MEKFDDVLIKLQKITDDCDEESKKFLKSQTKLLKKKVVNTAKTRIKKRTGNYLKGIKEGKIYTYKNNFSQRVYSAAKHAHLIEEGHKIIRKKEGIELGKTEGKNILKDSLNNFIADFEQNSETFLDKLFEDF